jgi:uncharacterized protein (DUF1778 family)
MALKRTYTQGAMEKAVLFHASTRDIELLRRAASQQEVSRSHFIRQAIKEKASRVLARVDSHLASEVGSMVVLRGTAKSPKESKE